MTLIRHHYFRFIYILCGLVFLSACEQKNLLPTPTTPNQLAEDTIVIELDLTQKKAQPSTQPNKTSSTVTSNKNKDLTTLLAITPTTPSITPQVPVDQSIIEIKYADPALPAHLNNELQKIYQTPTIVRQTSLLDMANRILIMGYAQSSAKLLNQIDLDKLPENQLGRYLEAKAESQLMLGDSFGAIVWLRQAQVLAPNKDPLAMAKRLTLKAQAYEANGLSLAASKALIALSQLPTTLDPSQYNERIWSALTQINANKLSQSITTASSDTARAWYNLALLPLLHHDLDLQLTALQQWQQQWPTHSASIKLPGALASLADLRAHQPRRIALAMPLHGRLAMAGQAVVDGFIAARFEAQESLAVLPYIKVYDTTQLSSLDALYLQASADQMEMIIGPLDKDKVIELSQKEALPLPTLALNYTPLGTSDTTINNNTTINLIQFGLAVEDEAFQIATRSLAEGHKRIIILHQDQPWATRAAQSFSASWIELGGKIASQVSFSGAGDHSKAITQALLINQSNERVKALKKDLAGSGNLVKYEPRRRQDVDAIVLFSLPTDGRQIIPALAFHYAADLPVYASHHIYQGPTDTSRDRDLEKVIFTESPWLIEQPKIQQKVSQQFPNRERYTRLFAIGVDAYRLFPRLKQLQAFADSRVHGVTGLLQINNQGRIFTQSSWGKFKAGKVIVDPR
ncbi:MAG: outer membrane PBP1 activator LpoA protein [Oceanospirillaceae bacterium]|jgi:outer membrane PBP1 activator LpoA protein